MKNKLIIIIAVVIALAGSALYWKNQLKEKVAGPGQDQIAVDVPAINGVPVKTDIANKRPIAVVIENSIDARPQSGLTAADIVYETLAEGGITRLLAVYQTNSAKEIGPVRSARPYFNYLANQWGAAFTHVGGSAIALSELSAGKHTDLVDINEFFLGDYFTRVKTRPAPHNTYVSIDRLREYLEKKDKIDWPRAHTLGTFETIPTEQLQTTISTISAKFFTSGYDVLFQFDPTIGLYKRTNGGKAAIDKANNMPITPRNIVVQFVDDYVVPMEPADGIGLHLDQDGRALLFTGGKLTDGRWRYKNGTTDYQIADGQPMKFQPGQTWIILMPKSLTNNVTWK